MNVMPLHTSAAAEAQADWVPELSEDAQWVLDANLEQVPEARWAKSLRALVAQQVEIFTKLGCDQAAAWKLARAGVLAIAEYGRGRMFYLPNGESLKLALRDIEIYRRANRDTIEALADEYGMTVRSVQRIVHEQRRAHLDKVQGTLRFGE